MFVGVLDVIPVFAGMLVAPDIWGQPGRVLIDQPEIRAGQVVLGILFPSILLILVQP